MADFANLDQQMDGFRASDAAREEFIRDTVAKYKQLMHEHQDLKNDFQAEQDNRRRFQTQNREYQHQLDSNAFVMALIDGDAAIFQDALLQAANGDGGSEAASRLYNAIRDHVASLYNNSGHWPIMVQVYLSLEKLAIKLAQVGLIQSPLEFRTFAQRFSINQPLFSIIDVGQGKERADHKIKEMLRTFSDNPTCRHIIFGGCHDGGYLPNLDRIKHDPIKAGRITLLATTPMLKGFAELTSFKSTRFETVFKSEPLPDLPVYPVIASSSRPLNQVSARPPLRPTVNQDTLSEPSPGASAVSTSRSTTPSTATAESGEVKGDSWASVGKSGAPSNGNISIAPTSTKKTTKKYAYYNKEGQRLDLPLPPKDAAAYQSLEARMKKSGKKLCNHWHLGGKCENGDHCMFQHEPKLTPAQLNVLRYKTRSLACKNRYCENIDCYLGHQCALERDQGYCSFSDECHFRASHGMDPVKHMRYDRAGNVEYGPWRS